MNRIEPIVDTTGNTVNRYDESIAACLIAAGSLRQNDIDRAVRLSEAEAMDLVTVIQRLGLVGEADMAQALATVTGKNLLQGDEYIDSIEIPPELSIRFLKENCLLPLRRQDDVIPIVMGDPRDDYVIDAVKLATHCDVRCSVGQPSEIRAAVDRAANLLNEAGNEGADGLGPDLDVREEDVDQLRDMASEAPIIRTVNLLLQRAVESRASDIHVEPFEGSLRIRLRIDGILNEIEAPPTRSAAAVISRIKIMAGLNIAERRLPQDGRIKLRIIGKELDLRVSTLPTLYGESVVMRLLDKQSIAFDFDSLGFGGDVLDQFLSALYLPNGIVLVTGPTGSGKSTTLYAALSRLNTPERKIITVEDPVEYQLDGINQTQAKPQIGLDFSSALRSIVRQDPDIIMVGEMRDLETASIAVQSALTGHLVLSTLHTNDAAGTINRLLDMGVDDYLLTSTVNGILAQRLVRKLCNHCRRPRHILDSVARELDLSRFAPDDAWNLFEPVGCAECAGTGYRGRLAILEFLTMTDDIRALVMQQAVSSRIEDQARSDGMKTMYEDGMRKAIQGLTTLEEVLRVTQE